MVFSRKTLARRGDTGIVDRKCILPKAEALPAAPAAWGPPAPARPPRVRRSQATPRLWAFFSLNGTGWGF